MGMITAARSIPERTKQPTRIWLQCLPH